MSRTRASLAAFVEEAGPMAAILPFSMRMAPFSMTPREMVRSLPPLRRMGFGWARAGRVARVIRAREKAFKRRERGEQPQRSLRKALNRKGRKGKLRRAQRKA